MKSRQQAGLEELKITRAAQADGLGTPFQVPTCCAPVLPYRIVLPLAPFKATLLSSLDKTVMANARFVLEQWKMMMLLVA